MTAMTRKKIHFYNHAPFSACDVCVGRCKRQRKQFMQNDPKGILQCEEGSQCEP